MAAIGNTNLVATKNDLIISLVQRELISRAVMPAQLSDLSVYAGKGTKSISVPRAGSFTVENRASGAQATLAEVTYAADTINIDQKSTVGWVVDSADEVESSVDVQVDVAGRAGRALAKNFDALVLAGLEADATATTTAGAITKDVFLEMREILLKAEAELSMLRFVCGPGSESDLLAISEFADANKYGSAIIPNGMLGTLYGVPVIVSTQVDDDEFYMFDKEGYGYAVQQQLNMGERAAPEYGSRSVLRTMDIKWGHAGLQNDALLLKDNNA